MVRQRIILLPGGKFLPNLPQSAGKEDPLATVYWKYFEVMTLKYTNPPNLMEDMKKVNALYSEYYDPKNKPILLGVSRGGYLAYNLLNCAPTAFSKVVIHSAPFDLRRWDYLPKLPKKEWKEYFSINPAELLYHNLPPTLLLYGTLDRIVNYEQGGFAYIGLRRQFTPGVKKPDIKLVKINKGSHSLAYDSKIIEGVLFWLSKKVQDFGSLDRTSPVKPAVRISKEVVITPKGWYGKGNYWRCLKGKVVITPTGKQRKLASQRIAGVRIDISSRVPVAYLIIKGGKR